MGGLTAVTGPDALLRGSPQALGGPGHRAADSTEQRHESCGSRCVGEDLAMRACILVTGDPVDRP